MLANYLEIPVHNPHIIKDAVIATKHGGAGGNIKSINGITPRPNKNPQPDDSPDGNNNGNGFYQFGRGNGNDPGGDGGAPDDENNGITIEGPGGRPEGRRR